MGQFYSKNKCINIKVNLISPKKIPLVFMESYNSGSRTKCYKFKIPKNKRFNQNNISLKLLFDKTSQLLSDINLNINFTKKFNKNNKIYYDSDYISLEYGNMVLRLDKNYKLAYVILDISNHHMNLISN